MELNQFNQLVEDIEKSNCNFILIQGIPGSGKTTLAKALGKVFGSRYYEADQYFEKLGYFDVCKLNIAHTQCQCNVEADICSGYMAIVSNTSLTDWELKPYLEMGNPYIIRMETDYGSIHNIPEHTMKKMRSKTCSIKPNFIVR